MLDPREGVDADGTIRTGVDRARVPAAYEPVLGALREAVPGPVSLFLYGSVATGTARPPASDVDALTIGLPAAGAAAVGADLGRRFAGLCRGVEVGAAQPEDYLGDGDEAYGNRVFLRHYCVRLTGPDLAGGWGPLPADARAARGFNGDIAACLDRWRAEVDRGADGARLGRRVARKTLLAVAGLVSLHDGGWTTDRSGAARRWAQLRPSSADSLVELVAWSAGDRPPGRADLHRALADRPGAVVPGVVQDFAAAIGLWDAAPVRSAGTLAGARPHHPADPPEEHDP